MQQSFLTTLFFNEAYAYVNNLTGKYYSYLTIKVFVNKLQRVVKNLELTLGNIYIHEQIHKKVYQNLIIKKSCDNDNLSFQR